MRNFFIHVHFYEKVKSKATNQDVSHSKYSNLSWDLFVLDQMARAFGPDKDYESLGYTLLPCMNKLSIYAV